MLFIFIIIISSDRLNRILNRFGVDYETESTDLIEPIIIEEEIFTRYRNIFYIILSKLDCLTWFSFFLITFLVFLLIISCISLTKQVLAIIFKNSKNF